MKTCIPYIRVSTHKQGVSGLGLEAQQKMISDHCALKGLQIIAEYKEVVSGSGKKQRPELLKAMTHCKDSGSILVIAKLDRLSRNVEFLLSVINSGISIEFTDFQANGIAGKMLLTIFASLAEYERNLTSERTKAALAAKKAQGFKLGNPNMSVELSKKAAAESVKSRELNHHNTSNVKLQGRIQLMAHRGMKPIEIATALNAEGLRSTRGVPFSHQITRRILKTV